MKPIIECIQKHIMTFPELKNGCLMVDCLGNEPVEYVVEPIPCNPVYKKYTGGSCMKQFLFIFASREYYGQTVNQNIENLAFYENFAEWINRRRASRS